jgi:hypothetical protein
LPCPEVGSPWWTLCANAMPAMDVTNIEVRTILRRPGKTAAKGTLANFLGLTIPSCEEWAGE